MDIRIVERADYPTEGRGKVGGPRVGTAVADPGRSEERGESDRGKQPGRRLMEEDSERRIA